MATSARVGGAGESRIVYALVACGRTVLAEHTGTSGNFPTVTRVLLGKIPREDGKMSYVYDNHAFHYITEDGVTYLCLTDEDMKRRIPFAFLEDVKERFKTTYSAEAAHAAIAFAMNDDFSRVLRKQMEHYCDPEADAINRVRAQVDDLRGTMVENIEKLLQRGEKIELLVDRTDTLNSSAFRFERSAKDLKNKLWWKNARMYGVILLVLAVVVFFVVANECGGLTFEKC